MINKKIVDFAIRASNLCKSYGAVQALKDLSFEVNKGEIYGIIGPDGAGKTSLFRILTTLILADSGTASVVGLDVIKDYKQIRQCIGYMPGRFSLYQDLTVEENLTFFASFYHTTIKENYQLIEDIYKQIEPFKHRRAGKLSGGMKQKLALCCALIHQPSVLFLDEPTTGVDPVSRKEFWEMLKKLKNQDITILVSTPYMDEANLCDRIALILDGEFLQVDTPQHIIDSYPDELWSLQTDQMSQALKALRSDPAIKSAYSFGDSIHLTFNKESSKNTNPHPSPQPPPLSLNSIPPTIEDCFMLLSKTHPDAK